MLKHLKLTNVGPAPKMEIEFGRRLNLFTGDNGLGKSFLLDMAWWSMTQRWPAMINAKLAVGQKALPTDKKSKAEIDFAFFDSEKEYLSIFKPEYQVWMMKRQPFLAHEGLLFYALADGSFAVWDSAKLGRQKDFETGIVYSESMEPLPPYVFSPKEVWDGLQRPDGSWLCNGLIRDWAGWQKENGKSFESLKAVCEVLSTGRGECVVPGKLTRISLDDARDMPTLQMPYGQEVPVVHASSAMRRIISLAYFLVWCWEEHLKAKELMGKEPEQKSLFLIDEVEAHLHPKWQRTVIPSLMRVMNVLTNTAEVQLMVVTHSPLVMASVEPLFDPERDAWFDLDFEDKHVMLRKRDFEKHGDAATWLISEAFDLKSSRSVVYEKLLDEAAALLDSTSPSKEKIREMYEKLLSSLGPKDEFLFRWRSICDKKGW
jgi:predicted ATPase